MVIDAHSHKTKLNAFFLLLTNIQGLNAKLGIGFIFFCFRNMSNQENKDNTQSLKHQEKEDIDQLSRKLACSFAWNSCSEEGQIWGKTPPRLRRNSPEPPMVPRKQPRSRLNSDEIPSSARRLFFNPPQPSSI